MGDLAVFDIERCRDSRYHITDVHFDRAILDEFYPELAKLPYLDRIWVSERVPLETCDTAKAFLIRLKSQRRR